MRQEILKTSTRPQRAASSYLLQEVTRNAMGRLSHSAAYGFGSAPEEQRWKQAAEYIQGNVGLKAS